MESKDSKHGWSLIANKPKKALSDETITLKREEKARKARLRRSVSSPDIKHKKSTVSSRDMEQKVTVNESKPGFIMATRDNDIEQVKFYLDNPWFNPNITDTWGNTATHFAVMCKHKLIDLFCKDPRFDFSIRNKHQLMPHQLVEENEHELRRQLFPRYILNMIINQEANAMLADYLDGKYNPKILDEKAEEIKTKIHNDKVTQDTPLPKDAQLPNYATIQFIQKMLQFRMSLIANSHNQ